jgi:hypothetical protein
MIAKSVTKSVEIGGNDEIAIEMEERCSMCECSIPDGFVVLRHTETNNIICVPCLGLIALIDD